MCACRRAAARVGCNTVRTGSSLLQRLRSTVFGLLGGADFAHAQWARPLASTASGLLSWAPWTARGPAPDSFSCLSHALRLSSSSVIFLSSWISPSFAEFHGFSLRVKSFYFSSVYKTLSSSVMAASAKRKQEEKHLKMLREMTSLPPNRKCFDCDQRGPTYADMTTGSFVCTSCSGILWVAWTWTASQILSLSPT